MEDERQKQNRCRKHKITLCQYDFMLQTQNNKCVICGEEFTPDNPPQIDHEHESGFVRGLLCRNCNLMLGHVKDSPLALLKAAKYVLKNNVKDCFVYDENKTYERVLTSLKEAIEHTIFLEIQKKAHKIYSGVTPNEAIEKTLDLLKRLDNKETKIKDEVPWDLSEEEFVETALNFLNLIEEMRLTKRKDSL